MIILFVWIHECVDLTGQEVFHIHFSLLLQVGTVKQQNTGGLKINLKWCITIKTWIVTWCRHMIQLVWVIAHRHFPPKSLFAVVIRWSSSGATRMEEEGEACWKLFLSRLSWAAHNSGQGPKKRRTDLGETLLKHAKQIWSRTDGEYHK